MKVGDKIKVTAGVFKDAKGSIRVIDADERYLITFDDAALDLSDIHFNKSEIQHEN